MHIELTRSSVNRMLLFLSLRFSHTPSPIIQPPPFITKLLPSASIPPPGPQQQPRSFSSSLAVSWNSHPRIPPLPRLSVSLWMHFRIHTHIQRDPSPPPCIRKPGSKRCLLPSLSVRLFLSRPSLSHPRYEENSFNNARHALPHANYLAPESHPDPRSL